MIVIRNSIFETNSSSTHAIVIMPKEDYTKLKNNPDLWYHKDFGVCTLDEVKSHLDDYSLGILHDIENEAKENDEDVDYVQALWEADSGWYNIHLYVDNESYYEEDVTEYTTKSGDDIVVVCNYGHD